MTEGEAKQVSALVVQVQALTTTVLRLEKLIEKEVNDLKAEQIADLKIQITRLADDQRRAWEAIRALENGSSGQGGAFRVIHGFAVFFGSFLTAVAVVALGKIWH